MDFSRVGFVTKLSNFAFIIIDRNQDLYSGVPNNWGGLYRGLKIEVYLETNGVRALFMRNSILIILVQISSQSAKDSDSAFKISTSNMGLEGLWYF